MRAPRPLRGKDKEGACFGGRGAGRLRAGELRSRVLDARAGPGRRALCRRAASQASVPSLRAPLSGHGSSKAAGLPAPEPPKTADEGQERSGYPGRGRVSQWGKGRVL